MVTIKRIPTGIEGLDQIIEGGIPEGRSVIITGTAGSGKSTLGVQFLYSGAQLYGENGIFVTLQEELSDIKADMLRFGWDLQKLNDEGKLALIQSPTPFEIGGENPSIDTILDVIHKRAMEVKAKRIVFDSIAQLALPYSDVISLRRDIMRLSALLRELDCTTLMLTEMAGAENQISRYGVEEFVAQGVIVLYVTSSYRALQVTKMRGTKHDTGIHRMRITDKGIVVIPGEAPF